MLAYIRLHSCVSSFMSLAVFQVTKAFLAMLACIRLLSCVSSFMYPVIWGPAEALIAMLAGIRHLFSCAVNIAERDKENISGSYLPGSPLQTGLNLFDLHVSEAFRGIFSLRAFMVMSIIHSEPCSGQPICKPHQINSIDILTRAFLGIFWL